MKIYYREKSGGIEILRCFGIEGRVEIPGMIDGKLVISAVPYAFSSHMDEKEELKNASLWEVSEGLEFGRHKGDLVEHLADILAGRLAGAEAGDEAAVLLEVVGYLDGGELDGGVEIAERYDEQEVDDGVGHSVRIEHVLHEPGILPAGDKGTDGAGDTCNGLGEDDGHNAGHIHLHRQMRALAAVELAAHDALGVLHRYPALGIVHDDYEHDYRQGADYDEREGPIRPLHLQES